MQEVPRHAPIQQRRTDYIKTKTRTAIPRNSSQLLLLCCTRLLILVDCYSNWPDIIPMGQNTTTYHFSKVLRQSFGRTGVPDVLSSDQGPQFMAKSFQVFARHWEFVHSTSTPHYLQSNGKTGGWPTLHQFHTTLKVMAR